MYLVSGIDTTNRYEISEIMDLLLLRDESKKDVVDLAQQLVVKKYIVHRSHQITSIDAPTLLKKYSLKP